MKVIFVALTLHLCVFVSHCSHVRTDKNTIENLLSFDDLEDLKKAPTQPLFILESLVVMVHKYVEPGVSPMAARTMFSSLEALYEPYGECERIRNSPCAFSYIAHLRLLLVVYLVTLPLAMVEQMGWSTIPVAWVICYFLMSLEMIAVEGTSHFLIANIPSSCANSSLVCIVITLSIDLFALPAVENPFGHGTSDLRLFDYNLLTKESILETYDRWQADFHETSLSDERLEKYSEVQMKVVPSDEWAYW